jgi:hypothetical protein
MFKENKEGKEERKSRSQEGKRKKKGRESEREQAVNTR